MGWLNTFSGGVFLGISLFVLVPNAKEGIEEFLEESGVEGGWKEMPYVYALVWLSYSFLLLVEKVVFDASALLGKEKGHHHGHDHGHEEHEHEHHSASISKP